MKDEQGYVEVANSPQMLEELWTGALVLLVPLVWKIGLQATNERWLLGSFFTLKHWHMISCVCSRSVWMGSHHRPRMLCFMRRWRWWMESRFWGTWCSVQTISISICWVTDRYTHIHTHTQSRRHDVVRSLCLISFSFCIDVKRHYNCHKNILFKWTVNLLKNSNYNSLHGKLVFEMEKAQRVISHSL